MKTKLAFFAITACAISHAFGQSYPIGFVWNRQDDWKDVGQVEGRNWSFGNPGVDSRDQLVWSYEWIEGGVGLDSPGIPWYRVPSHLSVWVPRNCPNGTGDAGEKLWARSAPCDGPPISRFYMGHGYDSSVFPLTPLVRWTNPAGQGAVVSVAGSMVVSLYNYISPNGPFSTTPVDVVIAHYNSSGVAQAIVKSWKIEWTSSQAPQRLDLPPTQVTLAARDSIGITLRGRASSQSTGVVLTDASADDPTLKWSITLVSSAQTCYANCDGSTTQPVLTAGDFSCFLNKFRAGCP